MRYLIYYKGVKIEPVDLVTSQVSAKIGYKYVREQTLLDNFSLAETICKVVGCEGANVSLSKMGFQDLYSKLKFIIDSLEKSHPKKMREFYRRCSTSCTYSTTKFFSFKYIIRKEDDSYCTYNMEDRITHYEMVFKIYHNKGVMSFTYKTPFNYGDRDTVILHLIEQLGKHYNWEEKTGIFISSEGYQAWFDGVLLNYKSKKYFDTINGAFRTFLKEFIDDRSYTWRHF